MAIIPGSSSMRRRAIVLAVWVLAGWPVAADAQTEVVEYYHVDAIGSVRAVTDVHGNVVRRHDYYPFGVEYAPPAPTPDPLRFTGKERDVETGLDYFGARYYASRAGRFTTVDPQMGTELALLDPQRWNRYSYVGNRPTRLVDPDGRGWASTLFKVGKAVVKGDDIYSAVAGVVHDASTIFSMDARVGTGDRLSATGSLIWELSGIGDVFAGVKGAARVMGAMDDAGHAEKILRKGDRYSTPQNLIDEMTLDAAKEGQGVMIIPSLNDPKFKGMEKWSYLVTSASGRRSEVHYVRDPVTGKLMDFKFVYHPEQ
jgi:RHS repeat-associated protein